MQTDDCMHRHLTCEILKKYTIYNLDNNVLFTIHFDSLEYNLLLHTLTELNYRRRSKSASPTGGVGSNKSNCKTGGEMRCKLEWKKRRGGEKMGRGRRGAGEEGGKPDATSSGKQSVGDCSLQWEV